MASEPRVPDQGREPNPERPENARTFAMGDHGPFPGQAPTRSDEDIKRDIETALFYDTAVSSLGVEVQVDRGSVTMSGCVHSDLAKRMADEDAWKVAGVREVHNNLKVKESPTPSRAAGQDMVDAKPPIDIMGEPVQGNPPPRQQAAGGQPRQQQGQPANQGQIRRHGQGS